MISGRLAGHGEYAATHEIKGGGLGVYDADFYAEFLASFLDELGMEICLDDDESVGGSP